MTKVLLEAFAASSAHGISRAAATKAKPLQAMWIALFLIFLVMFLRSGISLLLKLNENKLTKVYHLDQAPFVFPDLYFCPNNPYSGSYPFTLTQEEANVLNGEVSRLIDKFSSLYNYPKDLPYIAYVWASRVQRSFSFPLLAKYMLSRREQSVLSATITSDLMEFPLEIKTFYNYENLICFQAILTDELKESMMNPMNIMEIRLSTDPHLTDFNFTGHTLNPISDSSNNSIEFSDWHPVRIFENLKVSGFTLLIVPAGAYPSMRFENNFHMAPGNSYTVKLKMMENACVEDLHETHCVKNHPKVAFKNALTGGPEFFSYSSAACFYKKVNADLINKTGCQFTMQPSLWQYREFPRCSNVSELTKALIKKANSISRKEHLNLELNATQYCKFKIPCTYQKYTASYSFDDAVNETDVPALAKLTEIAKQLQNGNHSAHLESIFRSYISEALLSVRISIESATSPQVLLTWSYTFTDFLADTGGLLGLYIGCSVLTLCELLELVYIAVSILLERRSESTKGTDPSADPSNKQGPHGHGAAIRVNGRRNRATSV